MTQYRKFFVALSGVLIAAGEALSDGELTLEDGGKVLIAAGIAYGVFRVPNSASRNAGG